MTPSHLALALPLLGLVACDDISVDGNGASIEFTGEDIQLLPAGFPLYPKAFSSQSLDGLVDAALGELSVRNAIEGVAGDICESIYGYTVCLDDLISSSDYAAIDAAVQAQVPEVDDWLRGKLVGQLNFFNPGPLATGIHEQVGRVFKGRVEFTDVRLSMKVKNRTSDVWGVPVRLKLYMGDGETVHDKQGLIVAANSDTGGGEVGDDYTVVLKPGESATIETDNLVTLVESMNEFRGFAVDYDADVEVADLDADAFASWLSKKKTDTDGNGVADELASWGLVFEDLRISVSGKGEVEFPVDLPDWLDDYVVP